MMQFELPPEQNYLGQLVNECSLAAYCITEPGAGSDVAGMSTTYRHVGDEFVLNGTKHFISNGSVAQWYVAFATRDRKMRQGGVADRPGRDGADRLGVREGVRRRPRHEDHDRCGAGAEPPEGVIRISELTIPPSRG
jgi:alkylation response protein AidB-like acyl-CoA dehydrogenase